MFIELDDSVAARVRSNDVPVVDFFDALVTAHRMGNLLLVLSRRQATEFREISHINRLAKRTLDFLSTKSNDYRAALRSSSRKILVNAIEDFHNYRIDGQTVHVSYRVFTLQHLMTQKFFLAEGRRDISLMSVLSEEYYRSIGYPSAYVTYRPLLGGGGALPQVLESEEITPQKGIVVCDRDNCGVTPPFVSNTTAHKAMFSAVTLGLCNNKLGVSEVSPFFGFEVTWGRTIENLVGPNLLQAYLTVNNRRTERAAFQSAFPDFPNLGNVEWEIWKYINLKDKTPNLAPQLQHIRDLYGAVPPSLLGRLEVISSLSLPGDTIDWVVENQAATRWTPTLKEAIKADLASAPFREAVETFALPLLTLAAGDTSARRS